MTSAIVNKVDKTYVDKVQWAATKLSVMGMLSVIYDASSKEFQAYIPYAENSQMGELYGRGETPEQAIFSLFLMMCREPVIFIEKGQHKGEEWFWFSKNKEFTRLRLGTNIL